MRLSRRYSVIATFLFGGVAALPGCADNPLAPEGGSFSADVDGEAWTASRFLSAQNSGDTLFAVTASDSSGVFIVFTFASVNPGSYTIGPAFASYFFDAGLHHWQADSSLGSGVIIVTTLTATRIVGTIVFQAVAVTQETQTTVNITNGVFDITF